MKRFRRLRTQSWESGTVLFLSNLISVNRVSQISKKGKKIFLRLPKREKIFWPGGRVSDSVPRVAERPFPFKPLVPWQAGKGPTALRIKAFLPLTIISSQNTWKMLSNFEMEICLDPASKVRCNFQRHVNCKSISIWAVLKLGTNQPTNQPTIQEAKQHPTLNFDKKTQPLLLTQ